MVGRSVAGIISRTCEEFRGLLLMSIFLVLSLVFSAAVSGHSPDLRLGYRYLGSLSLLAAISMVSLAVGMGLFRVRQTGVLMLSLTFLAGYGLWGMLVFLTGLVHGLYRLVLVAELLCLGIFFRRSLNELPAIIRRLFGRYRKASLAIRITMGIAGGYAGFLLVMSMGPVTAWDALETHWTIARYFARHHAAIFPFFNGNGGTPQLLRMVYTAFCVFGFDHQASHGAWILFPALLGLVYGVVRRISSSRAALALGLASFILLVLRPMFVTQPPLDFPVFVFGFGAVVAAVVFSLSDRGACPGRSDTGITPRKLIVLSGLLVGYAVGTKWHAGVLYPVILLLWLMAWDQRTSSAVGRRTLAWGMLLAVLPVSVFSVYDLIWTGNPFWHPSIPVFWDAEYWSAVSSNVFLLQEHMHVVRTRMYPSVVLDPIGSLTYILKSNVLVLPGLFFVPFALLRIREQWGRVIGILAGGGLFYVLGVTILVSADLRHVLLGMAMLLLLVPFGWDALMRRKFRWVALALPIIVIMGLAFKIADRRLPIIDHYLSTGQSVLIGPYFNENYVATFGLTAVHWANRHLPKDVLVVSDARRLGNLDRDWITIYPTVQCIIPVSPDMPADSLRRALRGIGATHLWVDRTETWKDSSIFPSVPRYLASWEELIAQNEWLEPVYTDSLVYIYRMK